MIHSFSAIDVASGHHRCRPMDAGIVRGRVCWRRHPAGLIVALTRVSHAAAVPQALATGYIRLFQGTPLLMQIFLAYFGIRILGFSVSAWMAAALALTFHASAFLGEIWRGCIEAVPPGQSEASRALGLSYYYRMRWVITCRRRRGLPWPRPSAF